MTITLGGLIVTAGVIGLVGTLALLIAALAAFGMSDAPQTKLNLWPLRIATLFFIALILLGKYSGL